MKKDKTEQIRPAGRYPELLEMIVDLTIFTQKWQTPQIAKLLGISKQGLQYHVNKKEKKA